MSEASSPAEPKLPETLDWYRDTFKWFVALASGILGFSVTLVKDRSIDNDLTKYSFLGVCIFFGISALFGVWAYLWAVKYGNSRENRDSYKNKIKTARSLEELGKWQTKVKEAEDAAKHEETYVKRSYSVMMYAFLLGIPAFAVLAGSLLLSKKPPAPERQARQVSVFLGYVGPFSPGASSMPEACNESQNVSSIVSQLKNRAKDIDYILVVGPADHRQVRTGASNRTLAMKRALWTERCISQQLPSELDSLIMTHTVSGPLNVNTRKEELLAEDHRVEVYAVMSGTSQLSTQPPHQPSSEVP